MALYRFENASRAVFQFDLRGNQMPCNQMDLPPVFKSVPGEAWKRALLRSSLARGRHGDLPIKEGWSVCVCSVVKEPSSAPSSADGAGDVRSTPQDRGMSGATGPAVAASVSGEMFP